MKWKICVMVCSTAAVFAAAGAELSPGQIPTATNSVRFLRRTPTNIVFQVRRPDGNMTNVVARGFVYTATNVLFESVRSDGTLTNIVVGPAPVPANPQSRLELINAPTFDHRVIARPRYQPLGDFWLPGEFQQLLDKRKEERRQKAP